MRLHATMPISRTLRATGGKKRHDQEVSAHSSEKSSTLAPAVVAGKEDFVYRATGFGVLCSCCYPADANTSRKTMLFSLSDAISSLAKGTKQYKQYKKYKSCAM